MSASGRTSKCTWSPTTGASGRSPSTRATTHPSRSSTTSNPSRSRTADTDAGTAQRFTSAPLTYKVTVDTDTQGAACTSISARAFCPRCTRARPPMPAFSTVSFTNGPVVKKL